MTSASNMPMPLFRRSYSCHLLDLGVVQRDGSVQSTENDVHSVVGDEVMQYDQKRYDSLLNISTGTLSAVQNEQELLEFNKLKIYS